MITKGNISGKGEQGNAYILTIMIGLVLSILSHMLISNVSTEFQKCRQMKEKLAAFNLAEAGIEKAIHELTRGCRRDRSCTCPLCTVETGGQPPEESSSGRIAPMGEKNIPLGDGSINIEIQAMDDKIIIISTGFIPNQKTPRVKERVKVVINNTDLRLELWENRG